MDQIDSISRLRVCMQVSSRSQNRPKILAAKCAEAGNAGDAGESREEKTLLTLLSWICLGQLYIPVPHTLNLNTAERTSPRDPLLTPQTPTSPWCSPDETLSPARPSSRPGVHCVEKQENPWAETGERGFQRTLQLRPRVNHNSCIPWSKRWTGGVAALCAH